MTKHVSAQHLFEDLDDRQFAWPEPLVIDILDEAYSDIVDREDRLTIVRLHHQVLRALYVGEGQRSALSRIELVAFCVARHIRPEVISRADQAVYSDLVQLVGVTCRTSPRFAARVVDRLNAALGPLSNEPRRARPRLTLRPLAARAAVA